MEVRDGDEPLVEEEASSMADDGEDFPDLPAQVKWYSRRRATGLIKLLGSKDSASGGST